MIKILYMFLTEPFRKSTTNTPLSWRMGMRWSHFPDWFKKIPCLLIKHKWGPWEDIKYCNLGVQRDCKICGKSDVSYD